MSSATDNNKRIAKNALFLYFRTFLVMIVSLYTSRVVLQVLGETDFGIYNVVGGIVMLFSFLNSAMSTATQRFLNFELGRNDIKAVERVFSMSMTAHLSIALFVLIAAETVGLWFLYTQMNIPDERMTAALWVYQFSVLGCCAQILRIPYNASIIAYEKMSFYAYVSIIEVLLKLGIVFLLVVTFTDKLITYSILMFAVLVVMNFVYKYYCNKHFTTCRYKFFWDGSFYKKLMSFSGWSLLGCVANVGASQGLNIMLNIFYGVVVNAAMGIAHQVSVAVNSFVSSFQTAFIPQIVKSYAAGERDYFMSLVFRASRLSYYLIFIIGLPVIICCNQVLHIWLTDVPEFTLQFTQLMIVFAMIDALSNPLWNSVQATGKIRNYQLWLSVLIISNLPISYALLKLGFSPVIAVFVRVLINAIIHFGRVAYLKLLVDLSIGRYLKEVMARVFIVTVLSIPIPLLIYRENAGFIYTVVTIVTTMISSSLIIFFFGLTKNEKKMIWEKGINILKRISTHK